MKKRTFAAIIWFYTGWYAGSMLAWGLDISPALGPILGTSVAAMIAGDPRGLIWNRSARQTLNTQSAATPEPA